MSRQRFFLSILPSLEWHEFQTCCLKLLADLGYSVESGPYGSADEGLDLFGSGPRGQFAAACTIQRRGVQDKLRRDTKKILNSLEAAPAEIFLFSQHPISRKPTELARFETELQELARLTHHDGVPASSEPTVAFRFYSAARIARELGDLPPTAECARYLTDRFRELSDDAASLVRRAVDDEFEGGVRSPQDSFVEALAKHSDSLPPELRIESLLNLMTTAWRDLRFNPFLAAKLLSSASLEEDQLNALLRPLLLAAVDRGPSQDEVEAFLEEARSLSVLANAAGLDTIASVALVSFRMIRELAYGAHSALGAASVIGRIEGLAHLAQGFWGKGFLSLSLRETCAYVELPAPFSELAKNWGDWYESRHQGTVLARLAPLIRDPVGTCRELSVEAFESRLLSIAPGCSDQLDCSWVLLAWSRTYPIMLQSEDETYDADSLSAVLDALPQDIANRSSHILATRLHCLLRNFFNRREIELLALFEKEFGHRRAQLLPPQLTHLQLEYASAMAIASDEAYGELLERTRLGRLIRSREARFLDDAIFRNERLEVSRLRERPISTRPPDLVMWLAEYAQRLFSNAVQRRISLNPLRALDFPVARRTQVLGPTIGSVVGQSIADEREHGLEGRSAFCARSTALFVMLSKRHRSLDTMAAYAREALKTDSFALVSNDRSIAYTAYAMFYYGSEAQKREAMSFAVELKRSLDALVPGPRESWVYLGGMRYAESTSECEFVEDLGRLVEDSFRSMRALLSVHEGAAVLSSQMLDCINDHADRGSLIAGSMTRSVPTPEVWNAVGTTLYNAAEDANAIALRCTGFYAIARWLAQTQGHTSQKFAFNLIRTGAIAASTQDPLPLEFLHDVAEFIDSDEAQSFFYKTDCVVPYFQLLSMRRADLPEATVERLRARLRRRWMRGVARAENLDL